MNDNELFSQVAKEIAAGIHDEGLWLKAFALENGDEAKSKAHYVRLRVEQLKSQQTTPDSIHVDPSNVVGKPASANRWMLLVLIFSVLAIAAALFQKTANAPIKQETVAPGTQKQIPDLTYDPIEEMRRAGISLGSEQGTIFINGEITSSTAQQFEYAKSLIPPGNMVTVYLNSPGGDLYAAMAIGRTLRKVEGGGVAAVMDDAKCYSACVFILAAGEQRIRRGSIGIHRPYSMAPSSDPRQSELWFAKISADSKAYLKEMRVREDLFDDMVNISPSEILIFKSTSEMDRYGLIKMDPVTEELISAVWMKNYGISDRSTLMKRKAGADRVCSNGFQFEGKKYTHQECFDAFLSGRLEMQ